MIDDGAIGPLREVHNWTDRPFWPQALALPADRPPVPPGFDWGLWLGPERDRPYHPSYTHALFRGWYDFGGGSVADMGNYSLWPIFMALDLPVPYSLEAQSSSSSQLDDQVSSITANDFAFPYANRVCFKFAAHGRWPALKLYWYDGGMRPFTPDELLEDGRSAPATGTLFVGDKGSILNGELIPAKRMVPPPLAQKVPSYMAPQAVAQVAVVLNERLAGLSLREIRATLQERLRDARVIVVAAGMEGALASVVGGLTDKPVIAVPTSVAACRSANSVHSR